MKTAELEFNRPLPPSVRWRWELIEDRSFDFDVASDPEEVEEA